VTEDTEPHEDDPNEDLVEPEPKNDPVEEEPDAVPA